MSKEENQKDLFKGVALSSTDAKTLSNLEHEIGRPLRELSEIKKDSFGFQTRDGRVIGLGLYKSNLITFPESITKLFYLQFMNLSDNKLVSLPEITNEFKNFENQIFLGLLSLSVSSKGMPTTSEFRPYQRVLGRDGSIPRDRFSDQRTTITSRIFPMQALGRSISLARTMA